MVIVVKLFGGIADHFAEFDPNRTAEFLVHQLVQIKSLVRSEHRLADFVGYERNEAALKVSRQISGF